MNLRDVLQEHRMTIKEVAELTGISISTLYKYQEGSREPGIRRLIQIADVIGCTTDKLLGR